eukprot:scaffold201042_cov52-Attheya_sp.AAC.1
MECEQGNLGVHSQWQNSNNQADGSQGSRNRGRNNKGPSKEAGCTEAVPKAARKVAACRKYSPRR